MGRSAQTRSKPGTAGEPPTTGEDLDVRLADALDATGKLLDRLAGGPVVCEEAVFELIDLNDRLGSLRVACEDSAADEFAISAAFEAGVAEGEQRAAARQQFPPQRKNGGSHGKQPPIIRLIKGGLAALGAGAAIRVLHGTAAGPHAAAVKLTAAALTVGVPTAAVAVTVLLPNHTLEDRHDYPGGTSSPAAVVPGATWLAPQQQRLIAAITRPAAKGKAAQMASGSPSALPLLAPSPLPLLTPSSAPDSTPAAGGRDQDGSPATQAPGQLELSTSSVDLSEDSQAQITLTASGGTVDWQATDIPDGVTLNWTQGRIWAGMSYTITVSRTADLTGTGPVSFEINGVAVSVYLPAPVVPAPDPSPSASSTDQPVIPDPAQSPSEQPSLPGA